MIYLITIGTYAITAALAIAGAYLWWGLAPALFMASGAFAIACVVMALIGLAMVPDQPQTPSTRPAGEPPRGR